MKQLLLFSFIIALLPIAAASAQQSVPARNRQDGAHLLHQEPAVRRTWANVGFGLGTVQEEDKNYLAGGFGFHHQSGPDLFSLRTAVCTGITGKEGWTDYGLLYGRAATSGRAETGRAVHASFSAGLALVRSNDDEIYAVGLPLQMQVFVFGGPAGIGLYGFANINAEQSFAGATLSVLVGAL